jgi:acyl-CoA synthetase (AMP-forming)/AMP-acid ligase II
MAGAIETALATGQIVRTVIPLEQGPDLTTPAGGYQPVPVDVQPEDACCILFTGGTTGTSKGVVISHRAALSNCINEISDCRIGALPDDIGLIAAPMFHSAALLCWFLPHYLTGTASYLLNKFDEHQVGEVVTRERITNMFLVPNMIHRLQQSDAFQSVGFQTTFRALHTGAGALHMSDKIALASTLPRADVYIRYGLTEAGPMVSRLLPHDLLDPSLDGSIGKEYLLTEVQLRDTSTGLPTLPGEIGEIFVRGPSLMSGYYGHPDATAEVLRNGWLQTGDLGVRDTRGYLFFRGRVKDLIKTGGESVYSVEIEQALSTHPAVLDVVVLGVPSREWTEEVRAVVAVRPGTAITEPELRAYLRQTLAAYKVPKVIALVPPGAIPVNAAGKYVKKTVREAMGW